MEWCREVKGIGRERMGVVGWLPEPPIGMEMAGWDEQEEEEEEEEEVDPEALPDREKWWWCMRPSGLVVSERGCACSE